MSLIQTDLFEDLEASQFSLHSPAFAVLGKFSVAERRARVANTVVCFRKVPGSKLRLETGHHSFLFFLVPPGT